MSDKQKVKPVTEELAMEAQKAYQAQAGKDQQAKQGGKPSQLDLNPGWGGKGK